MKNIILALMMISPAMAYAQSPDREALARQVDEYVQTVGSAASRFLSKDLSPTERIKTIEPFALIYDAKQVEAFKTVVLDDGEPAEVRAMALDKIFAHVLGDQRLQKLTTEWLVNPQVSMVLRREALKLEANLSFLSTGAPEAYQQLLDDPEIDFRVFGFTKLVIHGDARAQQKLINGLEKPETASLPAPTAIGILSMALKKEYYPAVYGVLQSTKDETTRLEAIRAVGAYEPARETLIGISRNAREKVEFREAALGALYSGDRENIVQYVTPILADDSAPPRLQGIGIQMTIDIRQTSAYRFKNKTADDYDRLVRKLTKDARDPEVRKIAGRYVEAVRPGY